MEARLHQTLYVRAEADVLRITLNRPEQENSINSIMMTELHGALDLAEGSSDCHVVVLEGSSGVFCTGMDFADAIRGGNGMATQGGKQFLGLLARLTVIPRTVVALVDGRVAGGGVGLAAASDFVYASPRSTFSLPEALWGLLPCCVLPFLIRRVGYQPAHAMTLSTLPLTADQAHALHLADELTEDFDGVLRRLRVRLGKLDPSTIGDAKRYLRRLWPVPDDAGDTAVTEFARLMSSPQVRDRISAFASAKVLPWERR